MLTSILLLTALTGANGSGDGGELLLQAAKRLQTDRELLDSVTLETTARGTPVSIRYNLVMGAEISGKLSRGRVSAVINDDWASVTHAGKPEVYFVAEADGTTLGQLLGLINSPTALMPHFALRLAQDQEMAVNAFAASWEDEVRLGETRTIQVDGRKLHEVVLNHLEGQERILIDPDSDRIVQRIATREGQKLAIAHQWNQSDAPARPFAFEPVERKLAPELLSVLTASTGDRAPLFDLTKLEGGTQSLRDALSESVVVLDFWATWCRPCLKGLKQIQEFVTLAESEGLRVQVFAVNVSERIDGEPREQMVRAFWERNAYTFPVLLDPDDSVRQAYGAAEIPLTLVIDQQGRITAVHGEADRDLVRWLKTNTTP